MRRAFLVPFFMVLFLAAWAVAEDAPQVVTDPGQAFMTGAIVVKGEGAAPADKSLSAVQRRIMALRAAKVVALREVTEIVDGVSVNGETAVSNAALESDVVRTTVQGIVRGAQVIKEAYDPLSGMAVVYVSVPMTGPNGLIGQLLPQVIPLVPQQQMPLFMPPADMIQPKDFDGLILDVREKLFKPALINRILTKNGEVVYDPAKVAQEILVERGAAEYTNDIGKARALLNERGSNNPMVVRAAGVVKSTDVEIMPEDAGAVYSSNKASSFLEGAKVVFVLK